jgi:hypothetical protein
MNNLLLRIKYFICLKWNDFIRKLTNGIKGLHYPKLNIKRCYECSKKLNKEMGCWYQVRKIRGFNFSVPICDNCFDKETKDMKLERLNII